MQIDSGADANIIPYSEFQKFQSNIQLWPTSATLKPYNSSSIPIKGVFNAAITLSNKTTVQATLYVSESTATYNIMGKYTAFNLGILQINVHQINQDMQHTVGAHANSHKDVVKHMEYREIAKHLTPRETCQQLERFTSDSSNQQHKTEAILQQ